jgi:DNA-binding NarL/FixJ family response regulator
MTERLRIAIRAASPERQRLLAERIEAAGHDLVEIKADLVLIDASGGAEDIDDALRAAADLIEPAPEIPAEPGFRAATEAPAAVLTPREVEILSALGEGLSNKEAARALGISAHTVKFHLETIFRKLGATSRAEAVAKGLRQGILEI